jgi:hypothetical protein
MSVHIREDVLPALRDQIAHGSDAAFALRLSLTTPAERALFALDEVIAAVVETQVEVTRPFPGLWSHIRDGQGVVVTVEECDEPDTVLPAVADALSERGVSGEISLLVERQAPRFGAAGLIELRMRVRGCRTRIGARTYAWEADRLAFHRVLGNSLDWCVEKKASAFWLIAGTNPHVQLQPGEVRARVAEELRRSALVEVRAPDCGVAIDSSTGRVSLIETRHWRRTVGPLLEVLRAAAGDVAYALVKTGRAPGYVMMGVSVKEDWPPRPDVDAARVQRGAPFEDEYAPDAFPVQLLGPGYTGRIPRTPLYEQTPLGDATLLEHVDIAAWFESPVVPPALQWGEIGNAVPPPLLDEARRALAPILFVPPS